MVNDQRWFVRSDTFTTMASKILGSIGRFFITSGLVILAFVAYQLWGTGIQEASAQSNLGSDFESLLEAPSLDDLATTTTSTTTSSTTSTSIVEAAITTTTTTTTIPEAGGAIPVFEGELAEKLFREGGEAIAQITIPRIEVDKYIVEGVKVEDLRKAPGHYRATVFPGQEGNSGIAGHRTTYGAPFNRIDELQPGDEILVTTVQGDHVYRVMSADEAYGPEKTGSLTDYEVPEGQGDLGHIIVGPEATWVLGDFGDNRITLTACHPKFSARERIIVAAVLVSAPVGTVAPPEDYSTVDEIELPTENIAAEAAGEAPDDSEIDDEAVAAPGGSDDSGGGLASLSSENPAAEFTNEVSLDEGLNGDKSALQPAILWGVLGIILYLGFKELSTRWKRWPAIAMGIVPVVLVMGLSFEKLDRYLPAG